MARSSARRNRVRLYIPTQDIEGTSVDSSRALQEAQTLFARLFGGSTLFEATGSYVAESGALIVEDVRVIESYCTDNEYRAGIQQVRSLGRRIKLELGQEAIALVRNDVMEFL